MCSPKRNLSPLGVTHVATPLLISTFVFANPLAKPSISTKRPVDAMMWNCLPMREMLVPPSTMSSPLDEDWSSYDCMERSNALVGETEYRTCPHRVRSTNARWALVLPPLVGGAAAFSFVVDGWEVLLVPLCWVFITWVVDWEFRDASGMSWYSFPS